MWRYSIFERLYEFDVYSGNRIPYLLQMEVADFTSHGISPRSRAKPPESCLFYYKKGGFVIQTPKKAFSVKRECKIKRARFVVSWPARHQQECCAGEWEDTRHKEFRSDTRNAEHGWRTDSNPPNGDHLSQWNSNIDDN